MSMEKGPFPAGFAGKGPFVFQRTNATGDRVSPGWRVRAGRTSGSPGVPPACA